MLLGLTAAASAIDEGIQMKVYWSGTTTLIISEKEMNETMKIVKYLQQFGLLIKGVSETVNWGKRPKKWTLQYVITYIGC